MSMFVAVCVLCIAQPHRMPLLLAAGCAQVVARLAGAHISRLSLRNTFLFGLVLFRAATTCQSLLWSLRDVLGHLGSHCVVAVFSVTAASCCRNQHDHS